MKDTSDWVVGEFCRHSPLLSVHSILLYGHIAVEGLTPRMHFEQGEKELRTCTPAPQIQEKSLLLGCALGGIGEKDNNRI